MLRAGNQILDLSRPVVMGIVNLSPDSFYEGSRVEAVEILLEKAGNMQEEGAEIIDLGALSSRPGSMEIPEEEEAERLIPAIQALRKEFPSLVISADVFRPAVTAEALAAGAGIINNIHGMRATEEMLGNIASFHAAYVCMHSIGGFADMHREYEYENLATEVASGLMNAIHKAQQAGITDVIADPGFGFSKNLNQNFRLFREMGYLSVLGCPLLCGISRKSMIYRSLGCGPEEALNGSTALHMAALMQGSHILRVHDVKPAKETIRLFNELCLQES